jgi:hypothetical protein
MTADVEGIGKNLSLAIVCNVNAAGLVTGEQEGWVLSGTPYGTFQQLSPVVLGISHLSVEGFSIGQDQSPKRRQAEREPQIALRELFRGSLYSDKGMKWRESVGQAR